MYLKKDLNLLKDNLDYWIFIGIGDDIVKFKAHRKEYQHLVNLAKKRNVKTNNIPRFVNWYLKRELTRSIWFTYSFWMLLLK